MQKAKEKAVLLQDMHHLWYSTLLVCKALQNRGGKKG